MPRGKAKFATMDLNLGSDARDVTLVNPNIHDETPIVGTKEPMDMGMALKELDEDIEVKSWKRNLTNTVLGAGSGALMSSVLAGDNPKRDKKENDKDTLSAVAAGALTGGVAGGVARKFRRLRGFEHPTAALTGLSGGSLGLIASQVHSAKNKKKEFDQPLVVKELDEDIEVKAPTFQQAQRVMETLNKLPSRSGKVLEKIKNIPQGTLSMPRSLKDEFQSALDADAKRLGKYRKAANKVMDRAVGIKELSDDIIVKGITKRQVWDKAVDIVDRAAPGALTFGTLGYLGLRQTQDKNVRIKIGQNNPQPPTAIEGKGKMKKLGKRIREELAPPPIQVKVEKVEKGVFQQVIAGAKSIGRDFNEINKATGRFAKQHKATAGALAAAKVATWVPALTAAANAVGIPIPMVTMGLDESLVVKETGEEAFLRRIGQQRKNQFVWSGTKEGKKAISERAQRIEGRREKRSLAKDTIPKSLSSPPFKDYRDSAKKYTKGSSSSVRDYKPLPPERLIPRVEKPGPLKRVGERLSKKKGIYIPAAILATGVGINAYKNRKRDK